MAQSEKYRNKVEYLITFNIEFYIDLFSFQKHYQVTQPTYLLYLLPNTRVRCTTYCRVPESRQNSAAVGSGTSRGTPPLAQTSAAHWHSRHVCRQSPPARSKSFPKARLALGGPRLVR